MNGLWQPIYLLFVCMWLIYTAIDEEIIKCLHDGDIVKLLDTKLSVLNKIIHC